MMSTDERASGEGYVYLLHFERPISEQHTAQHYLGWASDLAARLQAHRLGSGSRLCQVAKEREITFILARAWLGGRRLERQLKEQHNAPRLCPVCSELQQPGLFELSPLELEWAEIAF